MKRLTSFLPLLIVFISQLGCVDSAEELIGENKIPAQISQYYRDYNFVSSFSSPGERSRLASYISISQKQLPTHLKHKRLRRICKLMRKLNLQVMQTDLGMLLGQPNLYKIRTELMKVCGAQRHGNGITVEVLVYNLDSGVNLQLISLYDKYRGDEKSIPSEEQCIEMAKSPTAPRREIHRWTLVDRNWLKAEANIILLEDKGYSPKQEASSTTVAGWGKPADGIQLKISTRKKVYCTGDDIIAVTFVLRNLLDRDIDAGNLFKKATVIMIRADGKPVEKSGVLGVWTKQKILSSKSAIHLSCRINRGRWFDMTVPGQYTVFWRVDKAVSNHLSLRLKKCIKEQ